MRKLSTLIVASTLALGAANIAYAADTGMMDGMKDDAGMMHHKGGRGQMHEGMLKNLKLTDEQKQQIREIIQQQRQSLQASSLNNRRAMHDLVTAEKFDPAQAQALIDKKVEENKARMLSHLQTQNKIYNILTPEQKKQFNENFEKRLTEHPSKPGKMSANR